jgi:hypothetical protein
MTEQFLVNGSLFTESDFIEAVKQNPINRTLLDELPALALPQCYLTAGCLFQAWWNQLVGLPAFNGVRDYDIFYFDDSDLSWEAEDANIQTVRSYFSKLDACLEVKNQARVHLWYERRFGIPYPKLSHVTDGIDRFLISCTCIGIEVSTGKLYAPNGLEELRRGHLRTNPLNPAAGLFLAKVRQYQARWPWLTVIEA